MAPHKRTGEKILVKRKSRLSTLEVNKCIKLSWGGRTVGEVVDNPVSGDMARAANIGRRDAGIYQWNPCPKCGSCRWVRLRRLVDPGKWCVPCSCKESPRKITTPEMLNKIKKTISSPKEGDLVLGRYLGRSDRSGYYRWTRCPICGGFRWKPNTERERRNVNGTCISCRKKSFIGPGNPCWRGGRFVASNGYVRVKLYPSDPYFSMTLGGRHGAGGYVAEHRLVVAMALGRCLEPWEIVHHKGDRYPIGSDENRQDNRYPENLELTIPEEHNAYTLMEQEIYKLRRQVAKLDRQLRRQRVNGVSPNGGSPSGR